MGVVSHPTAESSVTAAPAFAHRENFANPLPLSIQWNYDHRLEMGKTLPYLVKASRSGEDAETKSICYLSISR